MIEDMRFHTGPRPGEEMPDFDLPTVDGGRVTKSDFAGRTPLLLTMGSVTCPMTAAADPALKRLHADFGDRAAFVMLYVREAHPGDRYPQPEDFERKTAHARDLRDRDGLLWPVAVDDIDGTLHRLLDPKPNAAYLMDADGRVAFRILWSDDREHIVRQALETVLSGRSPVGEHQGRMVPMLRGVAEMDRVLALSGPTARRDVRKAAPPMYAMARLMGLRHRREKVPG
ncbi:thioredoxin family protein [Streptomyces sp. TRM70350]|uniref:TlpA family protein disulfide reductase n=1 Tax=Streptomyces sp. TRM70350 TaxID=2856165 RepID=UPI001C461255|nr:deiodinase-like protein [Streptomyces sp. TRM70350]MBV7697373.1 redoxin domain-containing protein [Streptomyces sp. TRM70350]